MTVTVLARTLGVAVVACLGASWITGCSPAGEGAGESATALPGASAPASAHPTANPTTDPTASPSATAAAPDPNHPDPCTLLTATDFEEVGAPEMSDGRFIGSLSGKERSICRWVPADPEASVPRIQVVINWTYADPAAQRELADQIGAATEDIEIEGASDAYVAFGGRTIGMTVGQDFVQVSYTRPDVKPAKVATANADFAARVAARLG